MIDAWKQWEGQVVDGEFHLRQCLSGSDYGAVFLTEFGRQSPQRAAIKLIPADTGNAELQLDRWRLAASFFHPHLIRVFQVGRCRLDDSELLYVVMEYAEENLSQILPQRSLTPAEVRVMLKSALDALAYLHSKGLVHGRLKPANIMAVDDQVKLSSDGLRRIGELSSGSGKPGVYDPPEAAGGASSPAGDVWSLGMTLIEALTQRLPVGESTEEGEPVLPGNIPAPFLDIARHCLRRDPQRRWGVGQLAARLMPASPAHQTQTTGGTQKMFAKWRYIVPMAAAGLVLAAILVGPRLLNRRPEGQQPASLAPEQQKVRPRSNQRSVTSETPPSVQATGASGQNLKAATPLPSSLRSAAGTKAPTSGLAQGEVLEQILPDVPQSARDTIRGTVRVTVRVAVDPSGSVVGASLDSPGPSKYFSNLALQAARRWEFVPPKVDRRYVPSEWILRFEFERTRTKAFPAQTSPVLVQQ